MDLGSNEAAPFTRWLVAERRLPSAFVLVDVGVQGGVAPRWAALGDRLEVYGFDPLQEAVAPLLAKARPQEHYFAMALGNEDGERDLYVQANSFATSFYAQEPSRFAVEEGVWRRAGLRRVPVRRLDTLHDRNLLTRVDFIKVDCEGFEPEVLKGGRRLFNAGGILGAEIETSFNVSPTVPSTHFWCSYEPMLQQRLLLFDIGFNRLPLRTYDQRIGSLREGQATIEARFRPATCNVLLARHHVQERDSPSSFPWSEPRAVTVDTILKSMIIFEVYGLIDWAYDLLLEYRDLLTSHIEIDKAAQMLVPIA